jgi:hypothetical protein
VTQASLQGQASIYSVIPVLQGQAEIPFLQNQAEMEKVQVLHNTAAFNRWITQTFHLPSDAGAEDLPAGRYIFGQGRADQTIAITADGRLLGFTKTREEIGEAEYTLSDDSHWRRHAEPVQEISSVAQMLQEIRKNQRHINDYAENLQGQVEFKQILAEPLPPKLLALDQFPLTTFLGTEQERIWKKICWEVPPVDQHSPESNYAWPFTLDDFLKKAQNEEADDGGEEARNGDEKPVTVEQTLQLLERLGLIVQVAPSTSSTRYYRRVTELDRGTWPARPESE